MQSDQDNADLEMLELATATDLAAEAIADAAVNARLREIAIELRDMAHRSMRLRGRESPGTGGWDVPAMRRLPA